MFLTLLYYINIPQPHGYESLPCGANIDGYIYNFEGVANNANEIDFGNATIVFSICQQLSEDRFIEGTYKAGISSVLFPGNKAESYFYGYTGTQYAEFNDNSDPNKGVNLIYYYSNIQDNIKRVTVLSIEYDEKEDFKCESVNYFEDISYINIKIKSKFAKPTKSPVPEEEYYQANCLVYSPAKDGKHYMTNLNLFNYQNGYVLESGENLIFYQPCSTMKCPASYSCNTNQSSAWVCKNQSCISYGTTMNPMDYVYRNDSFTVKYTESSQSLTVKYQCDRDGFLHSPDFTNAEISGNNLSISANILDICNPVRGSKNVYHFDKLNYDAKVDLNNKKYIGQTEFNLSDTFDLAYQPKVFANPVDILPCPEGYKCSGHRPSHGWLCYQNDTKRCLNIWHADEVPKISYNNKSLYAKVTLVYNGESDIQSIVNFKCNARPPIQDDEIAWLPNKTVKYYEKYNYFLYQFNSKDTCSMTWDFPDFDYQLPSSTSYPPQYIYESNGTHSIKIDLSSIFMFDVNSLCKTTMDYRKESLLFISPFADFGCPIAGACKSINKSDGYICTSRNDNPRCIPIMYLQEGYSYEFTKQGLNDGITIKFRGTDYITLSVRVECKKSSRYVIYDEPNIFHVHASSDGACVRPYIDPTPPPEPYVPASTPKTETVESYEIKGENETMKVTESTEIRGHVLLKGEMADQLANFYAYPGSAKRPEGNPETFGANNASVWKCWMAPKTSPFTCINVADARYGYKVEGNNVTIGGGHSGSSVTLSFVCSGKKEGPRHFNEHGVFRNNNYHLIVETPELCEWYDDDGSTSLWWIWLIPMTLALVFFLYIVIGSLVVKRRTGHWNVPNRNFWIDLTKSCSSCKCCRGNYSEISKDTDLILSSSFT